jgi:LCP family protein required for cell wall assembly
MPKFDRFSTDDGRTDAPAAREGVGSSAAAAPPSTAFDSAFEGLPFGDHPEDDDPTGDRALIGGPAATGATDTPGDDVPPTRRRVRRRRTKRRSVWKTALIILLATLCFLTLATVVSGYFLLRHWDHNVTRIPNVFNTSVLPPAARPPVVVKDATNMLLVGSDSRAGEQTTGTGGNSTAASPIGQRSDTMLLVHIDADKKAAWVVSIPRDSWVPIPGHGTNKINAAFSWGGPPLMVATVEQLTHVHIDHYAEIDFEGFKSMTDALGGVDVHVARTFASNGFHFTKGVDHMNGDMALAFVRNRYEQPRGDFDRINDQHAFLLALMQKASNLSLLTNPLKIGTLVDAVTKNVSVDSTFTGSKLRDFVLSMRDIKPSDVQFLTIPYKGTGMVGDQSVVFLDPTQDSGLYNALIHDTMNTWTPGS